ncbi:MAG: SUF system NifU family Fe-S cluster assembly protein [Chloroflexaceae bacterium]|nr:SUF system NifU family Fe-S cluster assembly protein [Chloroflexaceae bacterium]NJL34532.1 SUF system NifU family Fe-S cluster assembly protein [Chloroflexaceae bacterium]NJO04949.1 SUF system NifU family Fe-S cluster assembly protein [Chloroflexaceae bacterium]
MSSFYSEDILEHSKYPSNFGTLEHATCSHEEHNPLCGDRVRIDLMIEGDTVQDIRFSGKGCAISMASASMLTEAIKGQSVAAAHAFSKDDLLELIGIPLQHNPVRLKCALLSLKALKVGLYAAGSVGEE